MGLGVSSTLGPPQKGSTIILFVPFTLPPAWFPVLVGFPGFVGGFGLVVDRIVVVSFGYVCFAHPSCFPFVRGLGVVLLCWFSVGRLVPVSLEQLALLLRLAYLPSLLLGAFNTQCVWKPCLGGGFPLRCFQRLSVPNVANQRRPGRDDWHTRGSSTPVLSYWGRVSSGFLRAQRIGTELSHDVLNPARVPL